jgi:menaquinone-dependent protoporphyrinogen IX oxidase
MNGLIIYSSKYGATRQYAEWLNEELNIPLATTDEVTKQQIDAADYLLIGTSVYYAKFRIKKWLKLNQGILSNKKIFLFVVNATSPSEVETRNKFVENSVPPGIKDKFEVYFLPGRLIHKQLNLTDRLMLKIAERSVKDPVKRKAMQSDLNEVKKENLDFLMEAVHTFSSVTPEFQLSQIS